jgi:methionine-rich copper-binding protein CopC
MKLCFTAILSCLYVSAAGAHAFLQHANPAAGTSLKPAPREIALQFSEQLEPGFSGVEVTDSAAHNVAASATISGSSMHAALKPLPPGQYRVKWHAVSVDSHRTEGQFTFTVRP